MGNEHIGQAVLLLQILKQVQNLSLNGYIQRGNRLIADDKPRGNRQCPGNANSLPPSAVQLMGIGERITPGQTDGIHQLGHALFQLGLALTELHDLHGLGNQIANTLSGIQ